MKIHPQTLIILTTDQCTAECGHCCMNSGPKRKTKIDVDKACDTISDAKRLYDIKVVVLAGGEPTLLKDKLLKIINRCKNEGINSRIVTNVSWATSIERATTVFKRLYDAGLDEVNISSDDYHDEFIPFERIENAWAAAKKFAFKSVLIASASNSTSKITPEFINERLGEALPMRFDDSGQELLMGEGSRAGTTFYGLSNNTVQMLGRGQDYVLDPDRPDINQQQILNTACPNALRMPAMTPNGNLVACCGFEVANNDALDFGSLHHSSLKDLVSSANDNVIIQALNLLGPGFLLNFASLYGIKSAKPKKYIGICEVCQDVVTNDEIMAVLFENRAILAAAVKQMESSRKTGIVKAQLES